MVSGNAPTLPISTHPGFWSRVCACLEQYLHQLTLWLCSHLLFFRNKLICFLGPSKQPCWAGSHHVGWHLHAVVYPPGTGRTQASLPHQQEHAAHGLLLPLLFAFGECSRCFSPSELSAGPASSFSLVGTSSPKRCLDICRWMLFDGSCSFAGICLAGVWAFILPSKRSCFPFSTSPGRSLKVLWGGQEKSQTIPLLTDPRTLNKFLFCIYAS